MRGIPRRWLFPLVGVVVSLGTLGCERWPWETEAKSASVPATGQPPGQAASPARGTIAVPPQERVALVNDVPVSTADVELATEELKRLVESFQQAWQPLSAQERPDALDLHDVMSNLVDAELKAQDARARGLDQRTEVQERLAYLTRNFYAQEWDRRQREQAVPTEEAIQQFYEQNKAAFVEPERIRVRQIATPTLAEAEAARARAVQGEVFAALARELSVGADKEEGGDIGWHLRALDRERLTLMGTTPAEQAFFPQLEPVAFALDAGQVSQPVKGPDGQFYIVQLEERKSVKQQTELDVHDAIKEGLTVQNLQQQLEELRSRAKIERFPERLEGVTQ